MLSGSAAGSVQHNRETVARYFKALATQIGHAEMKGDPEFDKLSPRLKQTLERLLAGDSEKEAASNLGISVHIVHVYVKTLYKHYNVNSRAELLARFLRS